VEYQVAGLWVAGVLTLMVYSFLVEDNPLFRLAEHLLVGTALGYAALVVLRNFLVPTVVMVLSPTASVAPVTRLMIGLGLVWGLLLMFWLVRPVRWLASWPLAIVFGVGSALAVGGALVGTLIPQVGATMGPLKGNELLDNLITFVIVVAGLAYFFFVARQESPVGRGIQSVARVGRWFLVVALGCVLGARAISLLGALVERFQFIGLWFTTILR
jgi:hypothetical protein